MRYETYWSLVLGDRTPDTVVCEFGLTDSSERGVSEWLGCAEITAWALRGGGGALPESESWHAHHHARAVQELVAAIVHSSPDATPASPAAVALIELVAATCESARLALERAGLTLDATAGFALLDLGIELLVNGDTTRAQIDRLRGFVDASIGQRRWEPSQCVPECAAISPRPGAPHCTRPLGHEGVHGSIDGSEWADSGLQAALSVAASELFAAEGEAIDPRYRAALRQAREWIERQIGGRR